MFTSSELGMTRNQILLARQKIEKVAALKKEIEVCSAIILGKAQKVLDIQKDYYRFSNLIQAACYPSLVESANNILKNHNDEIIKLQERIGKAFNKINEIRSLKEMFGYLLEDQKEEEQEEKISSINKPQG